MSQFNDHNRLTDSDDTTLSHIQACDPKGTCSVNTMICSLSGMFYIANFPELWEKKNLILLPCELFKYTKEPGFKKGKLQIVTPLLKQAQTRRHHIKYTLKRDN